MIKVQDEKTRSREKAPIAGLTKILLMSLGTGVIIGSALLFPGIGYAYKEFEKEKWERARRRGVLRNTIKRLERQNLVSWKEEEETLRLSLTENGRKKVLAYNLEKLSLKKQEMWDGLFRVIIFDIPENKRDARNIFRTKLKELGFFQWQKSVFVTPQKCKDEIDFLRHALNIATHVQYILAKEVPGLDIAALKEF